NPSGNYVINYKAILAWITANCIQASSTDGKPFPSQLRAGRILYYDAVPTDVPAAAYDHTQKNYQITWADQNQRFWKEYIDYALGVWRSPMNSVIGPQSPACSYGPGYAWGTMQISSTPATPSDPTGNVNYAGGYATGY